jgi:hypothetical protein
VEEEAIARSGMQSKRKKSIFGVVAVFKPDLSPDYKIDLLPFRKTVK